MCINRTLPERISMWALRSTEKLILDGTVVAESSLVAAASFASAFVSRRSRYSGAAYPELLFEAPSELENMVRDALDPANMPTAENGHAAAARGESEQVKSYPGAADHWSLVRDVCAEGGGLPACKSVELDGNRDNDHCHRNIDSHGHVNHDE